MKKKVYLVFGVVLVVAIVAISGQIFHSEAMKLITKANALVGQSFKKLHEQVESVLPTEKVDTKAKK